MNRAVWRTAFGALRTTWWGAYYYLFFGVYMTAQACAYLSSGKARFPYVMLAAQFSFLWPMALGRTPAHRELLRLPLSMREVGAVQFLLRVLVPSVSVILLLPLLAPIFARVPLPRQEWVLLACGLCAAFPIMVLVPLLPLPPAWRQLPGTLPEACDDPRLRWLSAAAVWVLAPALAILPFVSLHIGFTDWPWVSLTIGVTLAALVWTQRAKLAEAASRSAPGAATHAASGSGRRWRGWQGFLPLLLPFMGISCAFAIMPTLFAGVTLLRGALVTMFLLTVTLSASMSANLLLRCLRPLRQLPIAPRSLAGMLLAALLLPTLIACLFGATVAHALHPDRISVGHVALLCLLSLSCTALLFVPTLKKGRVRTQGPLFAFALLPQVAFALFIEREGIALPSDAWLLGVCLLALFLGLTWLTATLKSTAPPSFAGLGR